MMEIDPGQLRALVAAVSEGTFDGAARTLHVTPSAISQRIKALEASVGRVRYRARASGGFADRWFTGGVPVAALAEAPVVVFDRSDHLQDTYLRRRTRRRLEPPRHLVPDSAAFVEAIRLGFGWGMLPDQ